MAQSAAKIAFLEKTARETPEYEDILSFFGKLLAFLQGWKRETGISFDISGENVKEKVAGGLPLLAPENMNVCGTETGAFLLLLVDQVRKAGKDGDEQLAELASALAAGRLDLPVLFRACLRRERQVVEQAATAIAVPAPLLEFILETALKTALEPVAAGISPAAVEGWQESYCPVCGSRAGMAELSGEEGKRHLCCSTCSFTWPFKRLACPYCGNDDPKSLSYFQAGDGPTRVDVCRTCSRYIKTRDSRLGHADVPLDAEDLTTIHLDLLAAREGLERGK